MSDIEAGTRYFWRGLPGQEPNHNHIVIDSMSAACKVNARVVPPGTTAAITLVTINAADLVAAVTLGWLVKIP